MNKDSLKKWKTTKSEYLITDRWIRVRADTCVNPGGHVIEPYYVLEYPDFITCLVLSGDFKQVTLLKHYRHAINDFVLEVPAGIIEDGESPEETVTRELEEELGLVGADIHKTGQAYANPAMLTNKDHSFVAIGGTFNGKQDIGVGENFQVVTMPLSKLLSMIDDQNNVFQAMHASTIFFALNYIKKNKLQ